MQFLTISCFKKNPHWNNYDFLSHPWNALRKYMHHNSIFAYKNSIASLQSCWNISQFANISLFVPKWNKTINERKKNCPSIYKPFKIYISIQIYGSHGTMLLYDKTIILHSSEYITILRAIFLNALFYKIFFWSTTTNLTDKLFAPQVKLSGRGLAWLSQHTTTFKPKTFHSCNI